MGRPKKAPGEELRRQFPLAFKQEAVRQLTEGGRSLTEVAQSLGVRREMLVQWRRTLAGTPPRPAGRGAAAPSAPPAGVEPPEVELRRLRRRVAQLEEEQEILGKAMAFFAKRHG